MLRTRSMSTAIGLMVTMLLEAIGGPAVGVVVGQEKKLAGRPATSPPEAVNLFADAARLQNEGAFIVAVEDWEKFLQRFPQDPLADKARHYAGVCHLQLKQLDKAAAHFARVVADNPNFERAEDAYLNLGWCQFSLAGRENAELLGRSAATFTTYLEKFPRGKYADQARYFLGESQYLRGEQEKAIATYREFVSKHPESPLRSSGLYALGVAYEELQRFQDAGATFDLFLQENPKHDLAVEVRMRKAETLLQVGRAAEAEKLFAEVAEVPNFAAADFALSRQAFCVVKQDRMAEAGALYAKLATRYPASEHAAAAIISAGRCLYTAKKYDEATPWLNQSVAAGGPDATEAAHWLARIHLQNREPLKVIDLAEKVLARSAGHPYEVPLRMDQADALYELSEWRTDAVQRYLAIAAEFPEHTSAPQALYNAAFGAMELKQFDDGLRHARTFEQRYPKHSLLADVQFVSAECHLLRRDLDEAEVAFRRLLDAYPTHRDAGTWRVRRGLVMNLQKKYGAAIDFLSMSLGSLSQPDQLAEAQYLIGVSQYHEQKFVEAITSLNASLAASRKWRQADESLLFLAASQRGTEQLSAAAATLARLIEEFPDSKLLDQAYCRQGDYAYAAGDYPLAVKAYDIVLARYADSMFAPFASHGKGWAQLKAGQFPAAVATFTDLLTSHGHHALAADARLARGMCLRQTGQFQQALEDLASYLDTQPAQPARSDALYERGLVEVQLQQYPAAAKTFASILAEHDSYARAASVLYELGWAWKKAENPAESAAAFERLSQQFPDSPFAPEAAFHVGEDRYAKEQYAEAAPAYAAARQQGRGEVAEKATYKLAWSRFKLAQYDPAREAFREQVEKFPGGALAADARFMNAECLFKLARYEEALPAFAASIAMPAATQEIQTLAYLHGGQTAAQLQKWQQALDWLDEIPRKFTQSPYLAEALYERGWAKQNLKSVDAALADYDEAASRSRSEVGARARFMIGEIQFERKQYDEAIKNFLRVMHGFGGVQAPDEVKKWQAHAGWEAGRCAELLLQTAKTAPDRTRLLQDARTYYRYVTERHPQHTFARQASARLATLAKLP